MCLVKNCVPLVLVATLTASLAAARAHLPGGTLAGDWDTVLESPQRPWIFVITFRAEGQGWSGTMSMKGFGELPLHDIREDSGELRFQFPREFHSLPFEGRRTGAGIVGHVVEDGRAITVRLTRAVTLPPPANRVEAWEQDLGVAARELAAYDRSFSPAARRRFLRSVMRLKHEVTEKTDAQILVALSQAVALADNGHTWLRLSATRQGTFSTVFPIRVWWFNNGPYVVRAAPEFRRALGSRLAAIDGHPIADVRARVSTLSGGTSERRDYLNPIYLMNPDVLSGLGLIDDTSRASFTFEDAEGTPFTLAVRAQPEESESKIQEAWQELSPVIPRGNPAWATAIPADTTALPLYLRHPDRPYWFEFLAGSDILYFQYNRAEDAEAGPSFEEFGRSLLAFAAQHPARALVIDLRFNSGGNLYVAKDFFQALAQLPTLNRPGRLFVVTGPCTFSAGLYHAAQLKQLTRATFVGEMAGDRLDFWAEGGRIELPNSQGQIDYANGFHRYSGKDYPDRKPYYEELSVTTLIPGISAPLTSEDYFTRRDPAMEVIEAAIP